MWAKKSWRARLLINLLEGRYERQHLLVGMMNLAGAKLPHYRLSTCNIPMLVVLGRREVQ